MKRSTCFVIGAGASAEFGFPLGVGLKDRVRNTLVCLNSVAFLNNTDRFGRAVNALQEKPDQIMEAASIIRGAILHSASVDDFLYDFRENRLVVRLCRMAIAECILNAEAASYPMCELKSSNVDERVNGYASLSETWLGFLFQKIKRGHQPSEIRHALSSVSFVIFNYDRCVEHFLVASVRDAFGVSQEVAEDAVSDVPITHVYGSLGRLPSIRSVDEAVEFGGSDETCVSTVAKRIKTYSEDLTNEKHLSQIKSYVSTCERLVFLGYSFHRQGMELIFEGIDYSGKTVYGTTLGLHSSVINQLPIYFRGCNLIATSPDRAVDHLYQYQFDLI
ncbi:MAG: hypothetical protein Q8L59_16380 [Phenylobacterium sp.]|uniref:hypothetical protein n=1 Tax=Phenylobacterium sp. TaxID=1871053 RepID=UPI0027365BA1|nr:hypothetical protein [Phenylobacterium sp.]MDP1643750.1 hypothetical protein [Phenylobacterium sp.]MDP3118113.1 hypothetical protein [Phenylobacterium sp.]